MSKLKDGEPCKHPGCLNHRSHACESCGRISGINKMNRENEAEAVKALGDRIGYGNLMHLSSRIWKETLERKGLPPSGAFIVALEFEVFSAEDRKRQEDLIQRIHNHISYLRKNHILPEDFKLEDEKEVIEFVKTQIFYSVNEPKLNNMIHLYFKEKEIKDGTGSTESTYQ